MRLAWAVIPVFVIVVMIGIFSIGMSWDAITPENSIKIYTDKDVYYPGDNVIIFMENLHYEPIFSHHVPIYPIITNPEDERVFYCGLRFPSFGSLAPNIIYNVTWNMIDVCNERPLMPGTYQVQWFGQSAKNLTIYSYDPENVFYKGTNTFEIINPDYVLLEGLGIYQEEEFADMGDVHVHAKILVRIFGDKFDFSTDQYQYESKYIQFEDGDGDTIHRRASNVPLGYFFETMNFSVDRDCFIFPEGRQFCTYDDYSLKFFINKQKVDEIRDYVISEGDQILISYGNEDEVGISTQLMELED